MTFAHVVGRSIIFVFTIILARELGSSLFGTFSFAFSFVNFGFILADLGVSLYTVREISKDQTRARELLENGMPLKIVLSLLAGALMIVGMAITRPFVDHGDELGRVIPWLALYVFGDSFIRLFVAYFRAEHRMDIEAAINIFIRVLITGFGITVLYSDLFSSPFLIVILVYAAAHLLAALFLFENIRRIFPRLTFRFSFSAWKKILSHSWSFSLAIFFTSIYYNLDTLMIGIMRNDVEVGWYNAAYRIIFFLLMFVSTFQNVLLPVFSKLFSNAQEELSRVMGLAARIFFIATLPLAVGGLFVAYDLLDVIYGKEYLNGAFALQVLLWAVVVNGMSAVYITALQASGRQKDQLKATAAGAVTNAVLNLFVIPFYSLNGASITTLASELVVLGIVAIKLRPLLAYSPLPYVLRPALAAAIMGVTLWLLPSLHVLLTILVGAGVYLLALGATGAVRRSEIRHIKTLFSRG